MVDRVYAFEAWTSIVGVKTISFEEGQLLAWCGRASEYPRTLVVQGCVELASWLAARSSGFTQACLLDDIDNFRFERAPEVGDRLRLSVTVHSKSDCAVSIACRVDAGRGPIASGMLTVALVPLADYRDPESEAALWQEINGTA